MKLACNYYPETERLVRAGAIDIDYFKFPALGFQVDLLGDPDAFGAFAARVGALRPILLHGLYPACELSAAALAHGFDFTAMDRLVRLTGTPGVSLHPGLGKTAPAVSRIIENLRFLRERYAHLAFVSVENLDSPRFGPLIQPEVITEIVRESGCSLLLDISHAWCAARHLGLELRDYLNRLPLERVYEIHINGWIEKGGDTMCHVKINAQGYQILRELLARCAPGIVTVEYGRYNDRIGCGCPVLRPGTLNAAAMEEIAEQVRGVREII